VATVFLTSAAAQEKPKSLDPSKARTNYSFPVRPDRPPFRFQVQLDKSMTITGVSVVRQGASTPFQFLPSCDKNLTMELNEYDDKLELLKHADLNFDGFEDVQLMQYFHPHLATSVFCIYLWDDSAGRFRYAPEIPSINPLPHPESKTITVHQDFQGGPYIDITYRWNGTKVESIEENGRSYGSQNPECGFTDYCSRLINGEITITAERPAGCTDKPDVPLGCSPEAPGLHKKKRTVLQQK
jgi:hypothetical protein